MAYIVPESILDHQLCTSCKNYLSFPPTKVYGNGEIKCGRCSMDNDGGTISLFDFLAQNMLFPCINRFNECSELLSFIDVKEHEKNCKAPGWKCDKCPNYTGSALNLVHHIKTMHPRIFFLNPEMTCGLDEEFSKCAFYCDYQRNVILTLKVLWDLTSVSISYSTSVTRNIRKLKLALLVTTDNNDPKQCKDLKYLLLDPLVSQKFEPHIYSKIIRCKWSLDQIEPLATIQNYHSKSTGKFKRGSPISVSLHRQFMENYYILKTFAFDHYAMHIVCDFCENIYGSSGYCPDSYMYSDGSCYVCGACFFKGITKSLKNNGDTLEEVEDFYYDLLYFYCRFNCGNRYSSDHFLFHEEECPLNNTHSDRNLTQYEFKNVISDFSRFTENGKIFVDTRDDFQCSINYKVDTELGVINFQVEHEYYNYYICVHKWEDQTYSEVHNDFSMKIKNTNGPSLFALTIRTIQDV